MSFPLLISGYKGKWCKHCIFRQDEDMSCSCRIFGYIKLENSGEYAFEPVRSPECLQMEKDATNSKD